MMNNKIPIATIGLGLMGSSIATCLLAAGHEVLTLVRDLEKGKQAKAKIIKFLEQLKEEKMMDDDPLKVIERMVVTDNLGLLGGHEIVIESIHENIDDKRRLFHQLEQVLSSTAIIGSNTSAIPVTILQNGLKNPERVLGIHWGEPAHVTKFMEVICGNQTLLKYGEKIMKLAETWGKEPSLVKKDIRGFITNRLMYALLREGFHLVKNGYADYADIDRACRNDLGSWITFAGPFRYMDLTGIPAYLTVMQDLFPELDNSPEPPDFMGELVASGATGTSNAHGFYPYTEQSAEKWEKLFVDFTYDIRKLSEQYSRKVKDL
ncbi:MAG TPA: 3-hydroxyacyl-CoA dehydrogenase family protein [Flavitalea sp.]|nr:3-hydroxyacyl-CoA dehydrogenase family protein [Flavitalea sp.]